MDLLLTGTSNYLLTFRGIVMDNEDIPLFGSPILWHNTYPIGTKSGAITKRTEGLIFNLRVGGPYEVPISFIGFKSQNR